VPITCRFPICFVAEGKDIVYTLSDKRQLEGFLFLTKDYRLKTIN